MNSLIVFIFALIAVVVLSRPQGRVIQETTIIQNGGGRFGGPGGNFGRHGPFNHGPGFRGPGGNFGGPGRFGGPGGETIIKETVIRG